MQDAFFKRVDAADVININVAIKARMCLMQENDAT